MPAPRRRQPLPHLLRVCALAGLAGAALLWSQGSLASAATSPDPAAVARAYLAGRLAAQRASVTVADFAVVSERASSGARHVAFQQRVNGLPLFGASLSVSLDERGEQVTLVTGSDFPRIRAAVEATAFGQEKAIAIARAAAGVEGPLRDAAQATPVYFPLDASTAVRAWRVVLPASRPLGDWLVIVSAADGGPLLVRNLWVADHAGSTGQVFDPNPVVSSSGAIPPPVDCDSSANEAALSGEYMSRPLLGIDSGQGQLVGAYADLTAPGVFGAYKPAGLADEASHVYVYPCNDDRFEEVAVYYHVDRVQRLVQSLGFTGASAILDSPLPAHAHYFAGCNAFYTGASIVFGDGSPDACGVALLVDLAEDGDVVVHEYGHALQDDGIAGGYFITAEGAGLGEGFADFLAAAVHDDPCMFEWAAAIARVLLGLPCTPTPKEPLFTVLRDLVNKQHYPEDLHEDPHVSGLIWGGALWDLLRDFGGDQAARDKALTLALQSHFYLAETSGFADAAAALQQADTDLYSGADLTVIDNVLARRGIIAVNDPSGDADGDGCTNAQEVGPAPNAGGGRDPLDVWDFYDTPDGANVRDKVVNLLGDVLGVAGRFGALGTPGDPLAGPPPAAPAYHTAFDRGAQTGVNPWNVGPADGVINVLDDILGVAFQFGHSCA